MTSTLSKVWKNIKNFTRNLTAGTLLATTIAKTSLAENLTTSFTRPTSNILKTIENTSKALDTTLRNTAQGNILHTAGNIATFIPRAAGSVVEWVIKGVWHSTQYVSGAIQTAWNSYTTSWEHLKQSFSTSDASPDISPKDVELKDATPLGRDGNHGVLGKDYEASKSGLVRWMGNIKNSIVNIPTNILRTWTDIVAATAQRARWVLESVEGTAKGIKSSRSGVFAKWQSFGTKLKKVFTEGIRWSVKSVWKWLRNVANEGILKTWAATVGVASNAIGRLRGNTIKPLFSTKAKKDQQDNALENVWRFKKLTGYYTSTPRDSQNKQTTENKTEQKDDKEDDKISEDKSPEQKVEKPAQEDKAQTPQDDKKEESPKKSRRSRLRPFGKKKAKEESKKENWKTASDSKPEVKSEQKAEKKEQEKPKEEKEAPEEKKKWKQIHDQKKCLVSHDQKKLLMLQKLKKLHHQILPQAKRHQMKTKQQHHEKKIKWLMKHQRRKQQNKKAKRKKVKKRPENNSTP